MSNRFTNAGTRWHYCADTTQIHSDYYVGKLCAHFEFVFYASLEQAEPKDCKKISDLCKNDQTYEHGKWRTKSWQTKNQMCPFSRVHEFTVAKTPWNLFSTPFELPNKREGRKAGIRPRRQTNKLLTTRQQWRPYDQSKAYEIVWFYNRK